MKKEILAWWNNLDRHAKIKIFAEYIRISRNIISFLEFHLNYECIRRMYHEKNTYIDCD
jgi:hypothetical protein